jgi:hypothetical protein
MDFGSIPSGTDLRAQIKQMIDSFTPGHSVVWAARPSRSIAFDSIQLQQPEGCVRLHPASVAYEKAGLPLDSC